MADFLKSNPIALRHCLLYEFLQKHSVEHTVNMFWVVVRKDVINKKEAHFWFNQFTQGIFDINSDNKPITDMRDVLRNDKHALRACILYESLKYKQAGCGSSSIYLWSYNLMVSKVKLSPSFFLYNNFCDVVGDDVMKYREFDFWFYRFFNGEFDFNYERDKDKKIYELMDMPIDVMENIVEYLDIPNRINLAKTSRALHTFAEDQKLFHHTLRLIYSDFMATVSLGDSAYITYILNENGCVKHFGKRRTLFQGANYWKQALLDFKSILKNPKLHLNILEIKLDVSDYYHKALVSEKNVFKDLEDALKFPHYLNVTKVIIEDLPSDLMIKILSTLKPGYLTAISFASRYPNLDSMYTAVEMAQWKQAKQFDMRWPKYNCPLGHLYHFNKFHLYINDFSVEDIREMKKILFKSADFEKCSFVLSRKIDISIFEQEFGDALSEDLYIYHYPVPNSNQYFEIKVRDWEIYITRKNA